VIDIPPFCSFIGITLDIYGHLMKETNGPATDKLAHLALGSNDGKNNVAIY